MKVTRLSIANFRGIREMELEFQPRLNVFAGANGSGKSTILDCLAIMFSNCRVLTTDRLDSTAQDIARGQDAFTCRLECVAIGANVATTLEYSESEMRSHFVEGDVDTPSMTSASRPISERREAIHESNDLSLGFPLVVYYPTNRAILDIPERIRGFRPAVNQLDALDGALGSYLDFRSFIARFRESEKVAAEELGTDGRWLISKEEYRELHPHVAWHVLQLKATKRAVESVVPEFTSLHVNQRPFAITIQKQGAPLNVLQLSDGEKCLIAMVGDLAQRLAIANPAMANPLEGEAVVLIDEIDLHLHPAWQRMVIPRLQMTFPNCQFIVSTHSPQVLGEVPPECVRCLYENGDQGVKFFIPKQSIGLGDGEIIEELMGTATRNAAVEDELKQVFGLIDDDKFDEARQKMAEVEKTTRGEIPELVRAQTMITMLEGESKFNLQQDADVQVERQERNETDHQE